jgi:endonuclease/exonuclease/phosphatase (EEP) superfamily protein YafD
MGRLLQGLLWLVAIWLILWNILRWWPGERWWPVALVNYFTPWVGLALLPLIALTWLFGQRALSLAFLAAVLLLGLHLAPHFVFKPSPPTVGYPLTVMTYNVHQRNRSIEPIVARILAEDADIVALQELTPDMSEQLAQNLGERYPYHTLQPDQSRWGQGLLSRYPLAQLSDVPNYRYQSAVVETPAGPIRVLNIHTPSLYPFDWQDDWERQRAFVQDLAGQIATAEGPVIVAGDFNTTPQSENYGLLRNHLRDAFLDSGWGLGFTFPATPKFGIRLPTPLVRIDYIFHSEQFASQDTRVLKDSGGSDHRPVVSVLSLTAE